MRFILLPYPRVYFRSHLNFHFPNFSMDFIKNGFWHFSISYSVCISKLNEINWNQRHLSVSCQFLKLTIYFASTEAQPTNGTVDWVFRIEIWLAGCPNLNLWNFTHFINIYRLQMLISILCSTKKIEASKQRESSGANLTRDREKKNHLKATKANRKRVVCSEK